MRMLRYQANPLRIAPDSEAVVMGRKYPYVSLGLLLDKALPVLQMMGLELTQLPGVRDGRQVVVTTLTCPMTREVLESVSYIPDDATAHQFGAWVTYLRRYQLSSLLLVHVPDDDGHGSMPPPDHGNARDHDHNGHDRREPEPARRPPPPRDDRPAPRRDDRNDDRRGDRRDDRRQEPAVDCFECGTQLRKSKFPDKQTGEFGWWCPDCRKASYPAGDRRPKYYDERN